MSFGIDWCGRLSGPTRRIRTADAATVERPTRGELVRGLAERARPVPPGALGPAAGGGLADVLRLPATRGHRLADPLDGADLPAGRHRALRLRGVEVSRGDCPRG